MEFSRVARRITLIASLLMGASFLTGMTLEDTQGRTLEATNIRMEGDEVTFVRADTGLVFTVPAGTFSQETLGKIREMQRLESLRAFFPNPGSTRRLQAKPGLDNSLHDHFRYGPFSGP